MENYDPQYQALILNMIHANRNDPQRQQTPPRDNDGAGASTSQQPPATPMETRQDVQPSTSYQTIEIAAQMRGKYRAKRLKKSEVVLVADADSTTPAGETPNYNIGDDMEIEPIPEIIYSGPVATGNTEGESAGASLEESEADAVEFGPTRPKRARKPQVATGNTEGESAGASSEDSEVEAVEFGPTSPKRARKHNC